ncbi:MAG: hypothetical protein V4612_02490 [Pseudomonadota bacterium]
MKNKFAIIALSMSLFTASTAIAQEEKGEENFAKHKAEIVANLNQEKGTIDGEIACVNSSQKRADAEKCREQRRIAMDKLKQQRIASQKAHLQEKIKKLDEKSSQVGQKTNK